MRLVQRIPRHLLRRIPAHVECLPGDDGGPLDVPCGEQQAVEMVQPLTAMVVVVEDAKQGGQFHPAAGLLPHLPNRAFARQLAHIAPAARQRPAPVVAALNQQNAPIAVKDRRIHHRVRRKIVPFFQKPAPDLGQRTPVHQSGQRRTQLQHLLEALDLIRIPGVAKTPVTNGPQLACGVEDRLFRGPLICRAHAGCSSSRRDCSGLAAAFSGITTS